MEEVYDQDEENTENVESKPQNEESEIVEADVVEISMGGANRVQAKEAIFRQAGANHVVADQVQVRQGGIVKLDCQFSGDHQRRCRICQRAGCCIQQLQRRRGYRKRCRPYGFERCSGYDSRQRRRNGPERGSPDGFSESNHGKRQQYRIFIFRKSGWRN